MVTIYILQLFIVKFSKFNPGGVWNCIIKPVHFEVGRFLIYANNFTNISLPTEKEKSWPQGTHGKSPNHLKTNLFTENIGEMIYENNLSKEGNNKVHRLISTKEREWKTMLRYNKECFVIVLRGHEGT